MCDGLVWCHACDPVLRVGVSLNTELIEPDWQQV